IIHVKKEGILWNDFFSTLPMGLSATCLTTGTGQTFCSGNTTASNSGKLQFILNGTENAVALDQIIQPGDKLLITFGNSTNTQIQQQYNQIPNPIASPSAQVQTEE
ncbi:MAG TPA: hypothetical protein PLD54_03180, partial [Candidatus Levybacteria bacterium]|nr:hypothetical protein [Candidatus Levybacteria bacterium]